MDWLDFTFKFSSELLVLGIAFVVIACNLFFFGGDTRHKYNDSSFAAQFLNNHPELNRKLAVSNNSIITTVARGNAFISEARADDFVGLSGNGLRDHSSEDVQLFIDDTTITKPNPDGVQSMITKQVIYDVQAGDTIKSIAAAKGVSVESIKWSNPGLTSNEVKPGWTLLVPTVNGIAVVADNNTTLPDLAHRYNPEKYNSNATIRENSAEKILESIISYNALGSAENVQAGDIIVVPGGQIVNTPVKPAPKPKPNTPATDRTLDAITSLGSGYDGISHIFPKGYCTWYVATRTKITFGGNAKNWLANAKASGYVTGKEAAPRSVVVTTDNKRYGHVAYVEQVTDTAILVSEMNYVKFNKVNQRWIPINSSSIRGYIYP